MTKIEFNEEILLYAFRYALGRKTYAVHEVVNYILDNWNLLAETTKQMILVEILKAIQEDNAGMEMDKFEWKRISEFARKLKNEN